jgi:Domain of unknown function (DUF4124)
MKSIFLKTLYPKLVAGIACTIALAASAQWQWLDKSGRKVYSDRPPPADILEKNIVKRPPGSAKSTVKADASLNADGTPAAGAEPAQNAPASQNSTAAVTAPKLSTLDKELMEKKKQAADAETAKRRAEDERVARVKGENCALGKQAKASLDSGQRIARINAKGEREVLDDAGRTAEAQRVQNIIDSSCK